MIKHCTETEPCMRDVYCNCNCEQCMQTDCFRPGCTCKKSHEERDKTDDSIEKFLRELKDKN